MTMTLSIIGSAHRLTEGNIRVKFNENRSKARNSRVNPMTLTCDLESG